MQRKSEREFQMRKSDNFQREHAYAKKRRHSDQDDDRRQHGDLLCERHDLSQGTRAQCGQDHRSSSNRK